MSSATWGKGDRLEVSADGRAEVIKPRLPETNWGFVPLWEVVR